MLPLAKCCFADTFELIYLCKLLLLFLSTSGILAMKKKPSTTARLNAEGRKHEQYHYCDETFRVDSRSRRGKFNGKVVTLKRRKSHETEVNLPSIKFNRIVTLISSLMVCFVVQYRLCTFWHNLHR